MVPSSQLNHGVQTRSIVYVFEREDLHLLQLKIINELQFSLDRKFVFPLETYFFHLANDYVLHNKENLSS